MRAPRAWLSLPLLLLSFSARAEGPPWLPDPEASDPARAILIADGRSPAEVPAAFATRDALAAIRGWRRVHIAKGAGLEVRQRLDLGEREVVLGLKGPVMERKRLGLSLEVRF